MFQITRQQPRVRCAYPGYGVIRKIKNNAPSYEASQTSASTTGWIMTMAMHWR